MPQNTGTGSRPPQHGNGGTWSHRNTATGAFDRTNGGSLYPTRSAVIRKIITRLGWRQR